MTVSDIASAVRPPRQLLDAMEYNAPFLIDKLLKEQIVETREDGESLFVEVIKYLILNWTYPGKRWSMFSRLIDEVWHQFVLFTVEYSAFCTRYFGGYLHHAPGNAPGTEPREPGSRAEEVADFQRHYKELFGTPTPRIWSDSESLTLKRRALHNDCAGALRVEYEAGDEFVTLASGKGGMLSVSKLALEALQFIVRNKVFYVRELPGDLTDDERVGLVEVLMSRHLLVLAA
jgi:hypothetical protein